ncbi:hypothetical protein RDWZM_003365 [Blomia tropicalis]|uniref:Signal recognition particle 19 kDa protein n=1 Tax=Blomia tropicalis TaxID=40697 RepID=A0A9Q0MF65_BLOTA|nr:signal recognition particle 19kDa [Blomia tropicalis]KAJ6224820.1 hypothetical protein RDWZM_003365 [Blomia tropicalis]
MAQAAKPSGNTLLDEKRQWRTIYPQYINSNLTIERGRRLPKSKCVPDPRINEIADVMAVNSAKFDFVLCPEKCYCREVDKENPIARGFIKYRVKNESFKNKREVLIFVAQLIPKLKSRQNPKANSVDTSKPSASATTNPTTNAPSGGGGGGGGNKKKKGRR